jgi:hypothetical protein
MMMIIGVMRMLLFFMLFNVIGYMDGNFHWIRNFIYNWYFDFFVDGIRFVNWIFDLIWDWYFDGVWYFLFSNVWLWVWYFYFDWVWFWYLNFLWFVDWYFDFIWYFLFYVYWIWLERGKRTSG